MDLKVKGGMSVCFCALYQSYAFAVLFSEVRSFVVFGYWISLTDMADQKCILGLHLYIFLQYCDI